MAKFQGQIGFVHTEETVPGVHTEVVTERSFTGDILRNNRRWENVGQINDDFVISNQFSIVADDYAFQNISFMRYLIWNGVKWKITLFDISRPRIILTVGGVYNG